MSNELTTYDFFGVVGRCVEGPDGEPWYVAKDACESLEIRNVAQAVSRLDDDEKAGIISNDTRSGQRRSFIIVSKSGLRALILSSRKGKAREYRKWVTAEVLPVIEKHGFYVDERRVDDVPPKVLETWRRITGCDKPNGQLKSMFDGEMIHDVRGAPVTAESVERAFAQEGVIHQLRRQLRPLVQ